jgi:hypothetical protein
MTNVTAADLAAIVLAGPLVVSVVTNAWALLWQPVAASPLGPLQHRLLLLAEVLVVVLLLQPIGPALQFTAAGVLYLALAAGVAFMLWRRGSVPCGCWGSDKHRVSWRLAAADLLLAVLAFSQVGEVRTIGVGSGLLVMLSGFALAFVFSVVLPDLRHVHRGAAKRAENDRRWFNGFPDLEDA